MKALCQNTLVVFLLWCEPVNMWNVSKVSTVYDAIFLFFNNVALEFFL